MRRTMPPADNPRKTILDLGATKKAGEQPCLRTDRVCVDDQPQRATLGRSGKGSSALSPALSPSYVEGEGD